MDRNGKPDAHKRAKLSQGAKNQLITGNEAVALGALRAGVRVVTGYPGTPSSGALGSLLQMDAGESRHFEWSTNEKIAFDIAAGTAWAGQRAMCTMKMSGLNVASDSVFSIAHSGVNGGLVIYVADDPGAHAGMVEQDSRGYARMMDLPMVEPMTVAEAYEMVILAFELSERIGSPVFVRSVTSIANSHAAVMVDEPVAPEDREPILERDIAKYTKAGSAIAQAQHHDVIRRLRQAGEAMREMGLNDLRLAHEPGGVGIISAGVVGAYLDEAFALLEDAVPQWRQPSVLRVRGTNPFPAEEARRLFARCDTIVVLEELEPHLERQAWVEARRSDFGGRIVGKLDGTFERVGEYGVGHVVRGVSEALGLEEPRAMERGAVYEKADRLTAARPITVCAGCPHRGTFLAINRALRQRKLHRDEVMVTGDIGCTILGMNPPFETVWNEVSMGASIGLAQGYVYSGLKTPVIATIGDSTFFHGGIPGLINAVQHQVDLTVIIMDNYWTAMTGMQTNPGTQATFQPSGNRRIDLAELIPAMGVEHFFVIDPFQLEEATTTVADALRLPGVKVVLARQECAIQAQRRGLRAGLVAVDAELCTACRRCITVTGCPSLSLDDETVSIDQGLCYGCSLCAQVCPFEAIEIKREGHP